MTPQMHAALIELIERSHGDGISEEEWAPLSLDKSDRRKSHFTSRTSTSLL